MVLVPSALTREACELLLDPLEPNGYVLKADVV
jgi:hypothetical protein